MPAPDTSTARPLAVGVDGCRGGWLAASVRTARDRAPRMIFSPTWAELTRALPSESTVLVDMILGLPDASRPRRACDRAARRILGREGSRIFPAPPREALRATDYREACALARAATGRAISRQTFFLFPKIRELAAAPDPRAREAHPELAFARLNGGSPLVASKQTARGRAHRLAVLDASLRGARDAFASVERHLPRRQAAPDDALDALALCALALRPDWLRPLPDSPAQADASETPLPRIWH